MRVVYGVLLVLNIGAVVADSILSNFPMVLFHLVCLFGLCILFFGAGIEHRKPEPETEPKPEPNRIIGPYLIENWPREANEKYCIYDIRLIEVSDADPELFWCCTAEDAAGLVKALIDELK